MILRVTYIYTSRTYFYAVSARCATPATFIPTVFTQVLAHYVSPNFRLINFLVFSGVIASSLILRKTFNIDGTGSSPLVHIVCPYIPVAEAACGTPGSKPHTIKPPPLAGFGLSKGKT